MQTHPHPSSDAVTVRRRTPEPARPSGAPGRAGAAAPRAAGPAPSRPGSRPVEPARADVGAGRGRLVWAFLAVLALVVP